MPVGLLRRAACCDSGLTRTAALQGNKASSGAGPVHVAIVLIKKEALTRCRGIICLLKSCGPKHLIIMGFDVAVGFLD